ncbi:MAG: SpoIIE family protein phosphatase [Spirochaetes bacterium]|nr:SpoIIE family protein phosphatase [Spirochaetota bacterium]MBN2771826.1 SpoIIE family protein phosphatase [Spirochaetota bacterium]
MIKISNYKTNAWIRKVAALAILLFLDIYFITSLYDFAHKYPFSRVIVDSTLHHSVDMFNKDHLFKAAIVSINDKPVTGSPLKAILETRADIRKAVIKKKDLNHTIQFRQNRFNSDFFIFSFFILIIANLHFIWGLILYFAKRLYSSSRYYSAASTALGLFFFSTIHYFISGNSAPLFVCAFLFAFIIIRILLHLSRLKFSKVMQAIVALIFLITAFTIITVVSPLKVIHYFKIYLYLFLGSSLIFGITAIVKNIGNRYRNKALLFLLAASTCGLYIPFLLIIPMLNFDFPIPVSITSLLTIIAPIVIGKTLIENSQISELITRNFSSRLIIIDIAASILISILLAGVFFMSQITRFLYLPMLFALLNIALACRKFIQSGKHHHEVSGKDLQTSSLQRIIETSVMPIDFSQRITRIYREISLHLDVESVKLAVFSSEQLNNTLKSSELVMTLDSDNPLFEHYRNNNDIIKRDMLYNSKIDSFMSKTPDMDKYYLIVPVFFRNSITALFFLTQKVRRIPYFKSEYEYISTAGSIAFQTLENESLIHQSIIKSRYEQDLDNASYVQMRLFPVYVPSETGLELSLYTRPYNKVTGDYLDVVEIDEFRTAIMIGDITGHGLPAAMLHSTTSVLITALFKQGKTLTEIFYAINDFLINKYLGHELITMFGAIFDKRTSSMEYVNAGHPPVYVIHPEKETFMRVESKGHILGVTDTAVYIPQKLTLSQKSQLFFFTDGLTEIKKEKVDSNIGEEHLEKMLKTMLKESVEKKMEGLTYYISKVKADCISDDITIAGVEIS